MKRVLNYIAAVTAAALLAPSCSTDGAGNIPEGQGLITMNVETGTRAAGKAVALEECTVGVYDLNQEGALVRKYAKGKCPEAIALVAGKYRVKVQYGEKPAAASFDNCYYEGQSKEITLAAGSAEPADVTCLPQSLAVEVHFGNDFAELFNSYAADVTLGDGVANGSLHYTANRTGYFTLPEGVTEMSWTFTGEHKTKGAITKTATFPVEMGKKYALGFKFSPDLPGYITTEVITLEIGDPIEWDDEFNFSNDPEITNPTNSGFFFEPQIYAGEAMTVQVDAQAEITKLSVEAAGQTFDLMTPAVEAAGMTRVNAAADRVTVVFNTPSSATITLNPSFFDFACGDTAVTFKVGDKDGGQAEKTATIRMEEGILPVAEADYDLWSNTVVLRAKSNGAAPVIKMRRAGDSEWQTATAAADGDSYAVTFAPAWTESQNGSGATIYTPDPAKGVYANHTYEAVAEIGDRTSGTTFTTVCEQPIVNWNMADASNSCFTTGNRYATFWGSGNNNYATALCAPGTFGGRTCAVLKSTMAGAFGINLLASGNLFTGTFYRPSTTGTVSFGQPYTWQARPTALRIQYHATVGTVNQQKHKKDGAHPQNIGDQDEAVVYVAIVDWDQRHDVSSGTSAPKGVWSPDAPATATDASGNAMKIVGYGMYRIDASTPGDNLVGKDIEIVYYDKELKPSKTYSLVISCATNFYGDYMCGCDSNELYVTDFEWVY